MAYAGAAAGQDLPALRPLRPLRLGPHLHAARPLFGRGAAEDRRDPQRRVSAKVTHSSPTFRRVAGRPRRYHRPARTFRARRRHRAAGKPTSRSRPSPGRMRWPPRWPPRTPPMRHGAGGALTPMPSPPITASMSAPPRRSPTSLGWRRWARPARPCLLPRLSRGRRRRLGAAAEAAPCGRLGGNSPASLPILENMGLVVAEETTTASRLGLRPAGGDHAFAMRPQTAPAARSRRGRAEAGSGAGRVWTGRSENDGFNAPHPRCRARLAIRSPSCAPSPFLRQAGIAFSQSYMEEGAEPERRHRPTGGGAVRGPLRPARGGDARGGGGGGGARGYRARPRRREEPRRGPHPAPLPQCRRRDAAHQCPGRRARTAPTARRSPSSSTASVSTNSRRHAAPGEIAGIYSPRVEACICASPGGARRHPLVGPARDFRRDPSASSKAAGEERHHRAGRPEGRLLSLNCPSRPRARRCDRRRRRLHGSSTRCSITDTIAGDGAIVRPPRSFTDGDDPYLVVAADKGTRDLFRHRQRDLAAARLLAGDAFASGARLATTTRRWASRRAAVGVVKRHFREIGRDIQTSPSPSSRRRRHVGRRLRQRHAAVEGDPPVAAFDHRDIFIDPDPAPAASWAERKRLRPAALVLGGLRQVAHLGGRRVFAVGEVDRPDAAMKALTGL